MEAEAEEGGWGGEDTEKGWWWLGNKRGTERDNFFLGQFMIYCVKATDPSKH
jgi:hypothetical protein